jgi:hypothetical protein
LNPIYKWVMGPIIGGLANGFTDATVPLRQDALANRASVTDWAPDASVSDGGPLFAASFHSLNASSGPCEGESCNRPGKRNRRSSACGTIVPLQLVPVPRVLPGARGPAPTGGAGRAAIRLRPSRPPRAFVRWRPQRGIMGTPPGSGASCLGPASKQVSPFAPRKNAAFAERKATMRQMLFRRSLPE